MYGNASREIFLVILPNALFYFETGFLVITQFI